MDPVVDAHHDGVMSLNALLQDIHDWCGSPLPATPRAPAAPTVATRPPHPRGTRRDVDGCGHGGGEQRPLRDRPRPLQVGRRAGGAEPAAAAAVDGAALGALAVLARGFGGRRAREAEELPPGQYLADGFPVLSAGPTQYVDTDDWSFTITTE